MSLPEELDEITFRLREQHVRLGPKIGLLAEARLHAMTAELLALSLRMRDAEFTQELTPSQRLFERLEHM